MTKLLELFYKKILLATHPVGSIYTSLNNTSPEILFGGTWEKLDGVFLFACDNNIESGTSGGSSTVVLRSNQLPEHTHAVGTGRGTSNMFLANTLPNYNGDSEEHVCSQLSYPEEAMPAYEQGVSSKALVLGMQYFNHYKKPINDNAKIVAVDSELSMAGDRGQPVNIMPPYLAVYMWKRIS